jgi:hypothetical protein
MIGENAERLTVGDVRDAQITFGVNHGDSEDQATWFDEADADEFAAMMQVVGAEFFFDPIP